MNLTGLSGNEPAESAAAITGPVAQTTKPIDKTMPLNARMAFRP